MSSSDRFTEHYRLLSTDPQMRSELLADPKAALAAYFGAVIDGDYRFEVIEQRPDTISAVIGRQHRRRSLTALAQIVPHGEAIAIRRRAIALVSLRPRIAAV